MAQGFIPKGNRVPHASMRNWWEKSVFVEGEVTETISPYRLQHLPSLFENLQQRVVEPLKELAWVLPVFIPLYLIQTASMNAYVHHRLSSFGEADLICIFSPSPPFLCFVPGRLEEKYHHEGDPFLVDKEK